MMLELATNDHTTSHNRNHVSASISSNERDWVMSKIFPNTRQRRKDANDMEAIKRRQEARRFIEKQQELEDLIKELSL